MDSVAAAAGVVRQTAYNYFSSKAELIEEVIAREARAVNAKARERLDWGRSGGDLLADAEVELLRAAAASDYRMFLLSPNAIESVARVIESSRLLRQVGDEYWLPIVGMLMARRELRPDLDADKAVRWLNFCHFVVAIRPSLLASSDDELRQMWLEFVVPALLDPSPRD